MRIIFSPWVNPLTYPEKREPPEEDEDDPDYQEAARSWGKRRKYKKDEDFEGQVLVGPAGAIPLHEGNDPTKMFNLWMLHADFDLTERRVATLEDVPGVETLDVFTRYRARVGIGKVFDDREVRRAIERALIPPPPPRGKAALDVLMSREG